MNQRRNFVTEGLIEIGPRADFFAFVDGDMIGKLLVQNSGVETQLGEYTKPGRARITVEWLDEDDSSRPG